MKKEKVELTKREKIELKEKRRVLVTRIVGFILIAVMVFALCANAFIK